MFSIYFWEGKFKGDTGSPGKKIHLEPPPEGT